MAAPTKFNAERSMSICEAIRTGTPLEAAARANGIAYDTLNEWRKSISEFSDAVEQARAEAERRMADLVWADASVSVSSAKWWLERRVPERWAPVARENKPDADGDLDLTLLEPEELETLLELVARAGGNA